MRDLESQEYEALGMGERLHVLGLLVRAVLDGPTLRACLDMRIEETQRIRKQMFEEARVSCATPCYNMIICSDELLLHYGERDSMSTV